MVVVVGQAEAERAQYESAFEALKRHIIRTYQNADQGFKVGREEGAG